MAAATAVFQALLPGDHVLVSRVLYFGVRKWLAEFALSWGLDVEFTDLAAACELAHAAGVRVAADNTAATPVHTRPFEHGPTW
jgi:cystathionine gamma-synthase